MLRVLTFNLRLPTPRDGPNYWDRRRDLVASLIREQDPDLLGTQELVGAAARFLGEKLPLTSWFGASRTGEEEDEHNGILYRRSRLALLDRGDFWLSENPDQPGSRSWGMHIPRTVTWGLFEERSTGRRVRFLNTHFPHRPEDAGARRRCAELIVARLDPEIPTILTGDFNCGPEEPPHEVLAGVLRDAWDQAGNRAGPAGTFHNFEGIAGLRMDWILYRGLRPLRVETLDWNQAGRYPSDHFPVLAEFE